MRIDKFLWSIRVYKTRTQATEACKAGKVLVNGLPAKASALIKIGELVSTRYESIYKKFEVLAFPPSRVAAKNVELYVIEKTDPADIEKLKLARLNKSAFRDPGKGRPTKKDRRDINRFFLED
ncbi:MAG TPA: RNA-binding protein [Flavobacteriales bacterium]|nr:RNA-binding protein [Flavobacteriales bacterium]